MDLADSGSSVLRPGVAIFLCAGAQNFRRGGCELGDVFLRVRSVEYRGESRLHAGHALAESGDRWHLFFSAVDRGGKISLADSIGGFGFAGVADQGADGDRWRAAVL